jgi:hypothetical protein
MSWPGVFTGLLTRPAWVGLVIGFTLVSAVSSKANTSSSISRRDTALSSAEFFTKEGCRPDSTSWTLSSYHMNEAAASFQSNPVKAKGTPSLTPCKLAKKWLDEDCRS